MFLHVASLGREPRDDGVAGGLVGVGRHEGGAEVGRVDPEGLPPLGLVVLVLGVAAGSLVAALGSRRALIGALVLHLMGLYDDRRAISAWPKLLLQLAVAVGTVLFSDVRLLASFLGDGSGEALSIVLTVVWIVVIVNAVNFIDNMDGLAGGIGMIAALCFMVATILNGQWFIASALALRIERGSSRALWALAVSYSLLCVLLIAALLVARPEEPRPRSEGRSNRINKK